MAPYMRAIYHRTRKYAARQNVADHQEHDYGSPPKRINKQEVDTAMIAQAINRIAPSNINDKANLIVQAAKRAMVKPADLVAAIERSR